MNVFFDIDDTLIDFKGAELNCMRYIYKSYQSVINLRQSEFRRIWRLISKRYYQLYLLNNISFEQQQINKLKDILEMFDISVADTEQIFDIYLSMFQNGLVLFDDVTPCLCSLSKHTLGIISNGNSSLQIKKLERTNIKNLFNYIIISDTAGAVKPDLHIFEYACKMSRCTAEQCIYIGNNYQKDIVPAKKMGMHTIWLRRKLNSKSPIPNKTDSADYVIGNLSKVYEIVQNINL